MTSTHTIAQPHPESACLIDASIYIFQYYFSMPQNWHSKDGYATEAVYGYTTFLLKLMQTYSPTVVAACFDESLGSCFRNEIYADYKCSRALPDESLAYQLNACRLVTECLGIVSFGSERYEADDLLATLARKLRRSHRPMAILTRDKDLGQLILREQDYLWDFAKDQRRYSADISAQFGVKPTQIADYLALVGDSIDDIPGVPGIGHKTASALLQHFDSVSNLFRVARTDPEKIARLPLRGAKSLPLKLLEYREQIAMACRLTTTVNNIPLDVGIRDLKCQQVDMSELQTLFTDLGFPRLYNRAEQALTQ